ncbi:MAG: hypothetical protein ACRC8B_22765 [Aeromonas sobria]|uniref:hypothetical protein n=1 Tax=Aeromonas sobria TaxID=646 RepID=UPI003F3E3968
MELEHISNDYTHYTYTEGHVNLELFRDAVVEYGHDVKNHPHHTYLVEKPVPDHHQNEFSSWFTFCDEDEPGAFPVTCLTL